LRRRVNEGGHTRRLKFRDLNAEAFTQGSGVHTGKRSEEEAPPIIVPFPSSEQQKLNSFLIDRVFLLEFSIDVIVLLRDTRTSARTHFDVGPKREVGEAAAAANGSCVVVVTV
jgi:hypothetical protein